MTDAACTVRCYGCDWTTTVIGMEAAQDAMSDHYKAKHWTPQSAVPAEGGRGFTTQGSANPDGEAVGVYRERLDQ